MPRKGKRRVSLDCQLLLPAGVAAAVLPTMVSAPAGVVFVMRGLETWLVAGIVRRCVFVRLGGDDELREEISSRAEKDQLKDRKRALLMVESLCICK